MLDLSKGLIGTATLVVLALGLDYIHELAVDMGQAASIPHSGAVIKKIIASVAVGLDVPLEIAEEGFGNLAGPGGMIQLNQCRPIRITSAKEPHIQNGCQIIGPPTHRFPMGDILLSAFAMV